MLYPSFDFINSLTNFKKFKRLEQISAFAGMKLNNLFMGKGDIKSRRGKIANKSYGARRPRKAKPVAVTTKKKTTKKKK